MIGIIDYGSGNLKSVFNAFRYLGEDAKICDGPESLKGADKIVLPGVGSGLDAMNGLKNAGFIEPLLERISKGTFFLGICLGLQLLYEKTYESGGCEGLGLIPGEVKLFPAENKLKVPQIGWNTVKIEKMDCPIFDGVDDETYFYFVHSYYCENKEPAYTAGITDYGTKYVSAVWKDNIFALQFHPERSQQNGLKILENFIKL